MSETPEQFQIDITFKSGVTVTADVEEFTRSGGPYSAESYNWKTPGEWTSKLIKFNLDEVVAIVARRDAFALPQTAVAADA